MTDYNLQYTGAQVESAISKVLNNEVVPQSTINLIYDNSKGIAQNSASIDELMVEAGISTKIAPTSGKFYDYVGASGVLSQGSIDFAKTYAEIITTGTNTIEMTSLLSAKDGASPTLLSDCFEVGEEVTVANDTIREIFNITDVNDGTATLTLSANIVGTFATGANVYRSNVKVGASSYKFGGFNAQEVIDKSTPVTVVNSAYSTEGNGGRKMVRTDNGKFWSFLHESGFGYHVYEVDELGVPQGRLCFIQNNAYQSKQSLVADGNNLVLLGLNSSSASLVWIVDVTTQTDVDINSSVIVVDSGQSAIKDTSLAIAPNGDLHATWSSKNATYQNSFNIRYSKSTNGGVTWGTVEQITKWNLSGYDWENPTIIIKNDGTPTIIMQQTNSSDYKIKVNNYTTTWDSANNGSGQDLFVGGIYTQSNPSADVLSDGTIIVAWHGKDSTDSTVDNIRFSQSTDNGVTWSAMEKLTSGNTYGQKFPTITRNELDEISIMFQGTRSGFASFFNIRLIQGNAGVWGVVENITSDNTTGIAYPSTVNNYREFTKPLTVWQNFTATSVEFYGVWTEGTEIDITTTDIRMNITPLQAVQDIGAYINISNNINTVDGQVSIVDTVESYTDLIDTRYLQDVNNDEVASFLNTALPPNDKVTLKYTLNRSLTTDDIDINSILGGVA